MWNRWLWMYMCNPTAKLPYHKFILYILSKSSGQCVGRKQNAHALSNTQTAYRKSGAWQASMHVCITHARTHARTHAHINTFLMSVLFCVVSDDNWCRRALWDARTWCQALRSSARNSWSSMSMLTRLIWNTGQVYCVLYHVTLTPARIQWAWVGVKTIVV